MHITADRNKEKLNLHLHTPRIVVKKKNVAGSVNMFLDHVLLML